MKKLIAITAMLFMAITPSFSQVFVTEDDDVAVLGNRDVAFNVMVPSENVEGDQFLPLGEGMLLLTGMAGAYLLRRRHNEKQGE